MTMTPTPAAPSGELLPCPFCGTPAGLVMGLPGCEPCAIVRRDAESWNRRAAVSQAAPERARHHFACERKGFNEFCQGCKQERALAAPSGAPKQPNDDYDQLDAMREAVSDFRKAAYEFGKRHDPADQVTMMEAQRRIFTEARNLAAASTVQSAPVLPGKLTREQVVDLLLDGIVIDSGARKLRNGDPLLFSIEELTDFANMSRESVAAQSTPVQVEGQQEPQAHVMPPFAAPAGKHSAWIAVDDALPAEREEVLICGQRWGSDERYQVVSRRVGDEWLDDDNSDEQGIYISVSHWMRLPLPPEQPHSAGSARQGGEHAPEIVQAGALPVAAAPEQKP